MTEEHKGESLIFGGALLTGLFPIITVLSFKTIPSMVSLTISTFLTSIIFFIVILYKGKLHELKNTLLWRYISIVVIFIGIFYYGFYYFGLTHTTPGNAVIIAINLGDIFILLATFFSPIGNLYQQKAKSISSTETILFLRSITATPFLLLIAFMFGQHFQLQPIKESFLLLVLNGFIMLGLSKVFWLEGISRISVTKASALSSLAPLFTLFVAWLLLGHIPTIWQVASLIPFFFGILLLTNNLKLKYGN